MEILGTLVKLQISAGKWIINPQSMVVHRFLNSPQILVKQCYTWLNYVNFEDFLVDPAEVC